MSVDRYLTIDNLPCLDPGRYHVDAEANGWPTEFWGRANSFTSSIGPDAGVAWVLVPRSTYTPLAANADGFHTLRWIDGATTTTFAELVLVSATCQAADGDSQGAYLVELRDTRHRMQGAGHARKRYNVSQAMPKGTDGDYRRCDSGSLNGGAEWTWQQMFDDVWGELPPGAGAAPTLPWTPAHNPESWRFDGVSAWEAVQQILAACQSATTCNPLTGALGVVALGTAQAGVAAAAAALATATILDWKPLQGQEFEGAPETIRVVFRARHRSPNTVEPLDIGHDKTEYHDYATGFTGATPNRKALVWSDLFAEMDDANNPLNLAAQVATGDAIGARCVLRYNVSGEDRRAEFSGCITSILPGTEVHQVRWRDYGDDDGMRTEWGAVRSWGDPTSHVCPLIRKTTRLAIVQFNQDFWSHSNGWARMAGCEVVRYFPSSNDYSDNGTDEATITVYHPIGYPGTTGPAVRALHTATGLWPCKHGRNDWAWAGFNDVSERWELLAPYEDHWRFELKDDMASQQAQAYLVLWDGIDWTAQTLEFTVYDALDLFNGAKAGQHGYAKYFGDSQKFEAIIISPQRLIRFKMKAQLSLAGTSTAIEIKTGAGYQEVGNVFPIKDPWDAPGSWREDVHATPRAAGKAYRGWCVIPANPELSGGDPIREIVWMEQLAEQITFTLTANMSGGSAAATVNNYYRGKDPADVWPTGFTVYDPQGLFPRALSGCKGKATYNNRDHRYECTTCDQQALMIRGTLTDNMCSSTGSISSAVRVTWPPYGKMPDPVPTSVTNPMALKGASGQEVFAVFNDTASEWQVWQVEHKSGAFVDTFGHDFDTDCGVLAATKKTIAYQECGESAAPDEVTLSEETVLVEDLASAIDDDTATSGQAASQCQVVLTYKTLPICTIQRNHATTPTATDVTLFQATPRKVVVDNQVSSTNLQQYFEWHYVICWEDEGWDTWHTGNTCS